MPGGTAWFGEDVPLTTSSVGLRNAKTNSNVREYKLEGKRKHQPFCSRVKETRCLKRMVGSD
jgi:hypothetical protein